MRKIISFIITAMCALTLHAEDTANSVDALLFTLNDSSVVAIDINATDSITFSEDRTNFMFHYGESVTTLPLSNVLDMTYGYMPTALTVTYNGAKAKVVNPYYLDGVTAEVDGAYVTINNNDSLTAHREPDWHNHRWQPYV